DPHVSSGVRSAGCNLIATRVFGMSETIAITGKSVKLFKGHYTLSGRFIQGPASVGRRASCRRRLWRARSGIGLSDQLTTGTSINCFPAIYRIAKQKAWVCFALWSIP
ncbi:MAG: hypothetical protein ACREYE_11670, partial [Gammaproteobacteria bacterium]